MKSKYEKLYKSPEKTIIFNDDPDLKPIEFTIPFECPPLENIVGYGLKPEDQFFVRDVMPAKIAELNKRKSDENGNFLTPRMKCDILEKNKEFYKEEIEWINKQWERRENGYWFFNNGVPTFITGEYYYFLNFWTEGGRYIFKYRNRDRKWFWFWYMVWNDDRCYGMNDPKPRRVGDTTKVSCMRYDYASRMVNFLSGLQSKTETDAKRVHDRFLTIPGNNVPFFFQGVQYGKINNTSELRWSTPNSVSHPDFGHPALGSLLDYRDSGVKSYDGSKQWLLHNDECGKTEEVDVDERFDVQKECLMHIDPESPRKGKCINTSTIGEMEKGGGINFKKLCSRSHYHERNENDETESGLYNLFIPATEGMEGFIPGTQIPFYDRYGNCDSQAVAKYLRIRKEELKKKNPAGYIRECQKYPETWRECWMTSNKLCNFNQLILEDRIHTLEHWTGATPPTIRGNFKWVNDVPDTRVEFRPHREGRFELSWNFPNPAGANRYYEMDGIRYPMNKAKFVAGGDPYKNIVVKGKKRSQGGGAVFMKHDLSIDDPRTDIKSWKSNRFICTYNFRPPTPEDFGEDMIMMCVYFGCEMYPEINVTSLWDHFRRRGYSGYLYYKFDPNKGKFSEQPGQTTLVKSKEQIYAVSETYIELHGHRECHLELLKQWSELEDDLGPFDLATAAGCALIAAGSASFDANEAEENCDIGDYFPQYTIG